MAGGKHRGLRIVIVLVVIAAIVVGGTVWFKFFRELPQQLANDTPAERYKYGSIGIEESQGLPYWIWLVLPKMFPEYLPQPGGWASLGLAWEQGREMPVGFSKKTIGFDRVAITCAFCHTARVRAPGQPVARIFPAGPGNTVAPLAYQNFLFNAASDPRFTGDNVIAAIGEIVRLSPIDRTLYRVVLVPAVRKALLEQKQQFEWTNHRPDWGRGRIDPFNPIKFRLLKSELYGNRPISEVDDGTIGNSDMQPIWNMRLRVQRQMAFHWDGLNTDLKEVVLSSALGDGATPKSLPLADLKSLQDYLEALQPPKFEEMFPNGINHQLASTGEPLYKEYCARCHAADGATTGKVMALNDNDWSEGVDPGAPRPRFTDGHRAAMWTPAAAKAYNTYSQRYKDKFEFSHFRSTGGYVSVPLDGLWIRAPYLHNGSVPYLAEVLEVPSKRTPLFYRGFDVYDPVRMGFVSEGPDAERGTRYDTSEAGNSNQGHLWGVQLTPEQKRALVEYLKTL